LDVKVREFGPMEKFDGQGRTTSASGVALFEQISDGGSARGVPLESKLNRGAQFGLPVVLEEPEELGGEGPGGFSALESAVDELSGFGHRPEQP